jgi:hypothetical protein
MIGTFTRLISLGIACIGLLGPVSSVSAHNGDVAVAVPVQGIVVDGDLSDWPAGIAVYSIRRVGEDSPQDFGDGAIADFRGTFSVGYNLAENAIYGAVRSALPGQP